MTARLELTRAQILGHRRRAGALEERLPYAADALRTAAWAGLQDSMPRAALLSIHARVEGTQPSSWEDPALVQVWGPRFSAYVVAAEDVAPFTLGRLPDDGPGRSRAEGAAASLQAFLKGRRMSYGEAGHGLGQNPNSLRYGTTTGMIRIRWDGARKPTVWTVPRPEIDPFEARVELARRYLHVSGPATADAFSKWAGVKPRRGRAAFDALATSLIPVQTPVGGALILATDELSFTAPPRPASGARLLPSGDAFFLFWGADRELLVPEANLRNTLWTTRVWPGAVLLDGDIVGTWRRAEHDLSIQPWRRLSPAERETVEAEAASLPLPDLRRPIQVSWLDEQSRLQPPTNGGGRGQDLDPDPSSIHPEPRSGRDEFVAFETAGGRKTVKLSSRTTVIHRWRFPRHLARPSSGARFDGA